MSGQNQEALALPVRHLILDRREYLLLLNACDVVLTMSTIIEGWNRTAHEAMLCRTPVIGSGIGGMKELLQGGGQVIKTDFRGLSETIMNVLKNKAQYEQRGYEYASQFDINYFRREWQTVIQDAKLNATDSVRPK